MLLGQCSVVRVIPFFVCPNCVSRSDIRFGHTKNGMMHTCVRVPGSTHGHTVVLSIVLQFFNNL